MRIKNFLFKIIMKLTYKIIIKKNNKEVYEMIWLC